MALVLTLSRPVFDIAAAITSAVLRFATIIGESRFEGWRLATIELHC